MKLLPDGRRGLNPLYHVVPSAFIRLLNVIVIFRDVLHATAKHARRRQEMIETFHLSR
jgi:hypothetical protein